MKAQWTPWISVESRLPKSDYPVLAVTDRKRICIARYDKDFRKWYDYESEQRNEYITSFNRLTGEVTHWMLLPEPPETAEQE